MNLKTTYWLFGILVALLVLAAVSLMTGPKPGDEGLLLADLRAPFADRWADCWPEWQHTEIVALAPSLVALARGEMPAATRYWWERTKGASKDSDLAAGILWLLAFSPRPLLAQVGAGDQDQAGELRKAARTWLHHNPALAQRVQADFDNYKKQQVARTTAEVERATGQLAEALLPVLDAAEAAYVNHPDEVGPLLNLLLAELRKHGLESVNLLGEPFDPNLADAVAHEPGEGGEVVVAEVLRSGYTWKGRTLRPAMVRTKD